jgi:DNA-binding response OmpR family regulator
MSSHRILVVDRSALAWNMYRLLFAPFECTVARAQALDDLLPAMKGLRGADLIVINSNVLGRKAERLVSMMQADERLALTPKVVLVNEAEVDKGLGAELGSISRCECVVKPFHPDEFVKRVQEILAV